MVLDKGGFKQPLEIHYCLTHASEAGIITQAAAEAGLSLQPLPLVPKPALKSTAIIAKQEEPTDLAISRALSADPAACGCGMSWQVFKQHGVLGCPQCYVTFDARLVPMIKRAQESFCQHAGKVPSRMIQTDPVRQITTARLRRELEQALTQENYEAAAKLRDELRVLGHN